MLHRPNVEQNDTVLHEQLLHKSPVVRMHTRSAPFPAAGSNGDETEDLTVVYKDAVVHVDGATLLTALRSRLVQVASGRDSGLELTRLVSKKWILKGQDDMTDAICCGVLVLYH